MPYALIRPALALALALALAVSAVGCATLTGNATTARIITEQAVARWVGDDPVRAAETQRIVLEIRPHVEDASVTLEALDQYIRDRIEWDALTPADRLLLHDLLRELRAELQHRFGERELSPHQRERLERFLTWVDEGARRAQAALGDV